MQQSKSRGAISSSITIPVSIIIAGALIAVAVYLTNTPASNGTAGAQQQQQQVAQKPDISKVTLDGRPYIGKKDAPVTIAYWYDYQCPFCQKNEEETLPSIIKNYVDTGKVRIVFKDFQFLGPDSDTLSDFSHAVWEVAPDKFYQWHKHIFDNQGTENTGWATHSEIMKLTTDVLGASDAAKVDSLVQSKSTQYQQQASVDKSEGATFGVNGTPSMMIGNQILVGAQPYSAAKQLIDLALQNAK